MGTDVEREWEGKKSMMCTKEYHWYTNTVISLCRCGESVVVGGCCVELGPTNRPVLE